ncbi:MAG: PRC-barrel domain-containing protein [Actinobacteria bacterium]|nr:PRC-barrel domain-containing protein [Actinomycetota bacterium]
MDRGGSVDPFAELKEVGDEYTVYDSHYEKLGRVDDLLMDERDRVLYVGVKMGFFGTNSTLVPTEIIRVNDRRRLIEVSEPADTIRHAPHFGRSEELTPELENHVRTYYGLESLQPSPDHEPQGPNIPEEPAKSPDHPDREDWAETVPIERMETEERSAPESEGPREGTPEREASGPVGDRETERTGSDEPISERVSDEPSSPWSRITGSGVTVHRLRR